MQKSSSKFPQICSKSSCNSQCEGKNKHKCCKKKETPAPVKTPTPTKAPVETKAPTKTPKTGVPVMTPRPSKAPTKDPTREPSNKPSTGTPVHTPVDCVDEWTKWSDCDYPSGTRGQCQKGTMSRKLVVKVPAKYGGKECVAKKEEKKCPPKLKPVDCDAPWQAWSECKATCSADSESADGFKTRERKIKTKGNVCGEQCPSDMSKKQSCVRVGCCKKTDCKSSYSNWSKCKCKGCETSGRKSRKLEIDKQESCGGRKCANIGSVDESTCTCPLPKKCECKPENCESKWGPWGACKGPRKCRERVIKTKENECGNKCTVHCTIPQNCYPLTALTAFIACNDYMSQHRPTRYTVHLPCIC